MLSDTDPQIQEILSAKLRELTPEEKLARLGQACHFVRCLVVSGILERHPGSSDEDTRRRFAAITLGPELAARYYGWDEKLHGY